MPIKSVRCHLCHHSTTSLRLLREHQRRAHLREFRTQANSDAIRLAKQTGVIEPPKVSAQQERVDAKPIHPDFEVPSSPQVEVFTAAVDHSDAPIEIGDKPVLNISRVRLAQGPQQQDRLQADSYRGAGAYSKFIAKTPPESLVATKKQEERLNQSIARVEGVEAIWKELRLGKPHAEIIKRTGRRKHDVIMDCIKQKIRESER